MPVEKEAVWTTLVILFWFWPLLLAVLYIAGATAWATVRLVRGYGGQLDGHAPEHSAPTIGS